MKVTSVAIYARVSTRDKGQDVENQLAQLRGYTERMGWKIVHEYLDQASGKTAMRGAFKELFAAAAERRFDVVLVWGLDRFTREGVLETFEHVRRLNQYGVQFESFTEPHFRTTGQAGELMLAVAAWIAKQERARMVERTLAGLARAASKGRYPGRPPKVVNVDELRKLREKGLSLRQIAARMQLAPATVMKRLAS